jgi:TatD DNase family protein
MFVDSHAHLEMPQFEEDLPQVLDRAREAGVEAILSCGTSLESSQRAIEISQRYPGVFAAVGIHPHDARECSPEGLARLRQMASHPRVVALGEMGLDFYRNLCPPEIQIQAFRGQIRLARELGKPIVVHDRDAHGLVLRILAEERAGEVGGVLHCFSGDTSMALRCMEMGLHVSVPGSVTFRNAALLRNVVLHLPLERMLLETDSPFLAPVPFRGKRNEPSYIRYTAERVARILKTPLDEVAQRTKQNAMELFGLG